MSELCVNRGVALSIHRESRSQHFRRSHANLDSRKLGIDEDVIGDDGSPRQLRRSTTATSAAGPSPGSKHHNHTRAFVHASHDLQKGASNGTDR